MDFLKDILGEELFNQFIQAINAHNGNVANKENQVKLANLGEGKYVSKDKYAALETSLNGKQTELDTANSLIAELEKGTKNNESLQTKIKSLYVNVADPVIEFPEFVQPTGTHDAYKKDDKVTYKGKKYISLIDNNVWAPDAYLQGWKNIN